ncbi:MAG: DNA-binding transcriptional regulator [Nitrosomonas sp.]|nr:DNA-binding transcriptional regulator [Nitrosomonas sp.]
MRKTKSTILEAVHDTAKGLHKAGVLDQVTLREFDRLCLPPIEPLGPEQIKQIREATRVSQAVFAAILNTSVSTVQKWEIGQKRPTGTALKLLHLVQSAVWKLSSEWANFLFLQQSMCLRNRIISFFLFVWALLI